MLGELLPRVLLALILGTATGVALGVAPETPVFVAVPSYVEQAFPSVAPTGDGYSIVWGHCVGQPYCAGSAHGEMRFARFSLAGDRLADDIILDIGPITYLTGCQITRIRDGYLVFGQEDAIFVRTLRLDAAGHQLAPSNQILNSIELYPFSVATSNSKTVLTYADWLGLYRNWSQEISDEGLPVGSRHMITFKGSTDAAGVRGGNAVYESPVARDGQNFVTAWGDSSSGIRLRELDGNGRPRGDIVSIEPAEGCWKPAAVTVVGGRQAVVYVRGCDQGDIYLKTRDRDGTLSLAIPLSTEPYDEGNAGCGIYEQALHVAGLRDRIGVVWRAFSPGSGYCGLWFFAEYDLMGNPLARRDLYAEFGLFTYDDLSLVADPDNSRFVIAWHGAGPQGWGVYYLPFDSVP